MSVSLIIKAAFPKLMLLLDTILLRTHLKAQADKLAAEDTTQNSIDDVTNAGSVTDIIDNIHNIKRKQK